jgi:arsenite transporter
LSHLRQTVRDPRFVSAGVIGNFVVLPGVVWCLMALAPPDPAVRLGMVLVLLVPCTDWFITFSHLGGGDTKYAIAFSPISLLLQIILLPIYLWLFLGETFTAAVAQREMVLAFAGLILLPLVFAYLSQKWAEGGVERYVQINRLGWLPVPLLAIVVFSIAATQVNLVMQSIDLLGRLLVVYSIFLVVAALMARILSQAFGLPLTQGRVLAFSFGTRNSFVVLPLAIALPSTFDLAVVTIVFQSLVELLGMVVYLWLVPKRLFPSAPKP